MTDRIPLAKRVTQWISSGEVELPVLDEVALRVYRESRAGLLDAEGICDLLKRDPVLVSDVLRLANSSFFGGLVEVRNLRHAVVRLGTRQLAALALSAGCKRLYRSSGEPFRGRLRELWRHTSAAAAAASWLAGRTPHRKLADEAFVAGLLHDIGKLLILRTLEELSERDGAPPTDEQIDEVIGALHCAQGASLLETWNLPELFPELVRQLEAAPPDTTNAVLCIVRLADRVCRREGLGLEPEAELVLEAMVESETLRVEAETLEELVDMLRTNFGAAASL